MPCVITNNELPKKTIKHLCFRALYNDGNDCNRFRSSAPHKNNNKIWLCSVLKVYYAGLLTHNSKSAPPPPLNSGERKRESSGGQASQRVNKEREGPEVARTNQWIREFKQKLSDCFTAVGFQSTNKHSHTSAQPFPHCRIFVWKQPKHTLLFASLCTCTEFSPALGQTDTQTSLCMTDWQQRRETGTEM